ncbi:hypothetical protein Sjap_020537 [Stephania japonica]|uniref:Uncharacterized protein n=1 Tax=Stephania japonica TaxID=461633 RepID=A0AAP0F881_9MAGN
MRELQLASAAKTFDEVSMERSKSFIKALQDSFYLKLSDEKLRHVHEQNFDHPMAVSFQYWDECLDPQDLEALWGNPEVSKQRIGAGKIDIRKFTFHTILMDNLISLKLK